MSKEVTGGMEDHSASSRVEPRISALERNDQTQDKQISELFSRVNALERQSSSQEATLRAMQTDISEAKTNSQQANDKLDRLMLWVLGLMGTTVVTLAITLIQLALSKKP